MPYTIASDKIIDDDNFLTIDFGCIYNEYCADITRISIFSEEVLE